MHGINTAVAATTNKFSGELKTLRKLKGLSQEQLAERSELDQSYIARIENGQDNVTLKTLRCLAKGLGLPAALLVGDKSLQHLDSTIEIKNIPKGSNYTGLVVTAVNPLTQELVVCFLEEVQGKVSKTSRLVPHPMFAIPRSFIDVQAIGPNKRKYELRTFETFKPPKTRKDFVVELHKFRYSTDLT